MTRQQLRIVSLFSTVILLISVIVLRAMGRSWWCGCGVYVPWSWDIWSSHNSQHLIDPYSATHVLHGVVLCSVLLLFRSRLPSHIRFMIAVAIEACWEILENSPMIIERYRAVTISLDYFGDSIANSISDIVACAIGYWIAASRHWWWSVALFAAVEIILLITIRDCLTLNVIMLVHPIEAIKEWQSN